MAKSYVGIVKYLIKAKFEVSGLVEKPDIVGAIFGQTEGLLGDDLDLRELQKNGKIGRIEVDTENKSGKCFGSITIPSSLDMAETSILAAALEVVDRVGPCDAKLLVERVEDTRNLKRKQVLGRARELLKSMLTNIPESKELSELIRGEIKTAEVGSYGTDNLAAGPDVASENEVILVEGRADVINMLKNDIKNVVAIGGANVGETVAKLLREKEATLFLDGDRGGDIILRQVVDAGDVDFVARAPNGKEVEELTRKEIIACLRRKVPIEQALNVNTSLHGEASAYKQERAQNEERRGEERRNEERGGRPQFQRPEYRRDERRNDERRGEERGARPSFGQRREFPPRAPSPAYSADSSAPAISSTPSSAGLSAPTAPKPVEATGVSVSSEDSAKLKASLKELEGTLHARILDASFNKIGEVPIREVIETLNSTTAPHAIALDGIVTQRLIDLAESKGAKLIAGIRLGNLTKKPSVGIVLAE
ncbi:DNA primase [Candidatus Micrarchaeota archaeon]|nr:DNA primase [Candidatus Micrarchaeota archaeon]